MNYQKFELQLAQLERAITNTKFNKYIDSRKNSYLNNLVTLYEEICKSNYKTLSVPELLVRKEILDFISTGIEYLNNSTLTLIPHEAVYCLETALKDWLTDFDDHIIVTSLSNETNWFFLGDSDAIARNKFIKSEYGITFTHGLIQIVLPKYLVHDYLSNVILYHELGHFIDSKYKITERIITYEPQFSNLSEDDQFQTYLFFREFFADIFAAQYIGESASHYLDYIAHMSPGGPEHPPTSQRIEIVLDFLKGNQNDIIDHFQKAIQSIKNTSLAIKYKKIPLDDFDNLIPYEVKTNEELHALFISGWDIWLDTDNKHRKTFETHDKCYKVINNLIEKSISNYMVTQKWKKANVPN